MFYAKNNSEMIDCVQVCSCSKSSLSFMSHDESKKLSLPELVVHFPEAKYAVSLDFCWFHLTKGDQDKQ